MRTHSRRQLLIAALSAALPPCPADARAAADTVGDFHAACAAGDLDAAQKLLAADPSLLNRRTPGGITPLGRAVVLEKTAIVKFLLDSGADPNLTKPDGAAPLHDAIGQKNIALVRLLLAHKANVEARWKDGTTPLLIAIGNGSAEIVNLLLAAGAKRDAPADDGRTPILLAVAIVAGGDSTATKSGAEALLGSMNVSLQATGQPLSDVLSKIIAAAGVTATIDISLNAPISTNLNTGIDSALLMIRRLARSAGQPFDITLKNGKLEARNSNRSATASVSAAAAEDWPVMTPNPRYRFDRSITRAVLDAYLSRAVTCLGLLSSSPENASPFFDDDVRMLTNIGAKFVGLSAYSWEPPGDDEAHFRLAAERAARLHAADPEIVLQAAVYETAYRKLESIPVPDWVFTEFRLPHAVRNFSYEAMLYDGGKFRDHWMHDASVPDMSKRETRMWFFYRARRYIDAGCEAIHFGQVHLMDQNDPSHGYWTEILTRIRRYAATHARRRFVLCTAHSHGVVLADGRLLFDHHAWPLRPAESRVGDPSALPGEMRPEFGDSIINHSRGGRTPSGWDCVSLPYLVEFDNFGVSGKPGQTGEGLPWIWGYDEISWFAHLSPADRNAFLISTFAWLRGHDRNGHLQMPGRRVLAAGVSGSNMYQANRPSAACPIGFGQEDTIKAIWAGD